MYIISSLYHKGFFLKEDPSGNSIIWNAVKTNAKQFSTESEANLFISKNKLSDKVVVIAL